MNFEIAVPTTASHIQELRWKKELQQQISNKKEICRKIQKAFSRNTDTSISNQNEEEQWAFGFNTEMNPLHDDHEENLQLQGCNCKYCGDYFGEYASPYFPHHVICRCAEIYISYYHRLRMELEASPTIVSGYSKYGNYLISYTENPPSYYKNDNPITQHIRKMKEMNAQFYDEYL